MRSLLSVGRVVLVALIVAAGNAAPVAAAARRVVLGRSVDGRPIVAVEVGSPSSAHRELVVGCIHGNEPAGIAIARRLEASSPRGLDLWVIPVLNPDGRAAMEKLAAEPGTGLFAGSTFGTGGRLPRKTCSSSSLTMTRGVISSRSDWASRP